MQSNSTTELDEIIAKAIPIRDRDCWREKARKENLRVLTKERILAYIQNVCNK